jgi:NAD(P)H-quinone oxidoreductase subunit L
LLDSLGTVNRTWADDAVRLWIDSDTMQKCNAERPLVSTWPNPDPLQSSDKPMIVAFLYLALGGAYLAVLPLLVFFYLKARWYVASSIERVFMYFLIFFCFPGLLLLAPFLNFRPARRQMAD